MVIDVTFGQMCAVLRAVNAQWSIVRQGLGARSFAAQTRRQAGQRDTVAQGVENLAQMLNSIR
jgi:hypothetical protein